MTEDKIQHQEPVAVIGFACRLPGGNNTPKKLWEFLESGQIASSKVPSTRFNFEGHYDGSQKPRTMRQPGGMFLSDVDPADFDAAFFEVGGTEAVSMAPDQRQMLEVVFESLENAGLPLKKLDDQAVGCFVGSYAADYADMHNRDPEDRPPNTPLGIGRAILANRLSHFLNVHGPSVTLDTACSGSLQGLDLACRYLQSGDINAAIVATSNLYMSPEHLIDAGSMGAAHSPTALCHTFDADADGYVKAEAVSAIIVKRLEDAIRDRDPIRAVVLGTATNSNGRTAGIASPSSISQAAAVRTAYAHAGITDYNLTTYLECHGTGTQAGDPTEVKGIGSVFAAQRPADKPLLIGSIKSNIGHSEPSAGISGLLKAILSIENGKIPGTPTFIKPSPKIDFIGNKVKAFRHTSPWPANAPKRASVSSYGFGGSNAHAVIEQYEGSEAQTHISSYRPVEDDYDEDEDDVAELEENAIPQLLVLSANDSDSLKANIQALGKHLINPAVKVSLKDLSYTLSERRNAFWHRAFITAKTQADVSFKPESWFIGKKSHSSAPTYGFVFTGQGAQWPQMGKDLLQYFPSTRNILAELDETLQSIPDPPSWSLLEELTQPRSAEHLRQPEFSQPLVTALQLCLIQVLKEWGIQPTAVIGHSSGEIAGAYAAGFLNRSSAILAAFYRGRAAVNLKDVATKNVGMLAVGLGSKDAQPFLEKYAGQAWIACYNSPNSVTVSGRVEVLTVLRDEIAAGGHFARLLQVDLAYHSALMNEIGEEYERLLTTSQIFKAEQNSAEATAWVSTVSATVKSTPADADYWKQNMVNPVRFSQGLSELLQGQQKTDYLIEIGPSGALAGPISQIVKSLPASVQSTTYISAWARGLDAGKTIFNLAGRLFTAGAPLDLSIVNQHTRDEKTIIDLPNYTWNHSVKYWYENAASKDWRFRKYVVHDLLGSKILGSSWHQPQWRSKINTANLPWLADHRTGGDIILPGAGFITIGLEAMFQKHKALLLPEEAQGLMQNDLCYKFRDCYFVRALVLEEGKDVVVTTTLSKMPGTKDWHEFRISSMENDTVSDHCRGQVRIQDEIDELMTAEEAAPLRSPQKSRLWYKYQREAGMDFGPTFQRVEQIEAVTGERKSRTLLNLEPAPFKFKSQSYYPVHPVALDACLQSTTPSNAACDRTNVKDVMIPRLIDEIVINKVPHVLTQGKSFATSNYVGRGRLELAKNWFANVKVHDTETGQLLVRVKGLNCVKLDVPPKPDPHTFHAVTWKPDVSLLIQDHVTYLEDGQYQSKAQSIIDLVAFKKPDLRVLEINLDESDGTSLWLSLRDSECRSAYEEYALLVPKVEAIVGLEQQYDEEQGASFSLLQAGQPNLGLETESIYDLLIVKIPEELPVFDADAAVLALQGLLGKHATILLLKTGQDLLAPGKITPFESLPSLIKNARETSATTSQDVSDDEKDESVGVPSSLSSWEEVTETKAPIGTKASADTQEVTENTTIRFEDPQCNTTAYLSQFSPTTVKSTQPLIVAQLRATSTEIPSALSKALTQAGWKIYHQRWSADRVQPDSVVLVIEELWKSLLRNMDSSTYEQLKSLVTSDKPVLWVTKGAQGQVTNPDNSMIHGLFRVARQEDPSLKLHTLDVESTTSPASIAAIETVLRLIKADNAETEYMERDGIINIQRVMPDKAVNTFRHSEEYGPELVTKKFHGTDVRVKLHAERLGTLNSLTWNEVESEAPELDPAHIEVEVMAVGVNYKDVAITMGIVPDDEFSLGYEAAGVIKRMGSAVSNFNIGDRVCMLNAGCYTNRIRVAAQRCHVIPATMTFEEAATIPSVYLCSLYAMYHLGCLQEGQSVLIHSATGGVGIACIQLAQLKKAEIFVTVGTEEKTKFLEENYSIPRSRIFSSRNTKFAGEIMKATNGVGVNCVINSVIGELLDASWRIMADGGNMVEIGKRDIIDRNFLSMEPFDRNCSFRALDLSYVKHMKDPIVAGLFTELFKLFNDGHLKPITPITTFGFDDVISALAYIRSGQHLGKIVISNGEKEDIDVHTRPYVPKLALRSDASYLIVGGLKGACGTLAIKMAQHGAKHIIVSSRSGITDDASARIVASCEFYGCKIVEARGDIGDASSTEALFKNAQPKIAGVIQGAMVLRDKPFENMTMDDWQTGVHAKVQGSWNIHNASLSTKSPLDFFTMLSSISGIVGNKGQANYAAANTFLDALASYRLKLGLHANTVDLGLIEDVGYVAEQDTGLETRFDKRQWTPINESTLRKILAYSIFQQSATPLNTSSASQLITGIGFPLPRNSGGGLDAEPRFSFLFSGRAGGDKSGESSGAADDPVEQAVKAFNIMNKTAGADAGALLESCIKAVSAQFVRILRLESEPEPGRPLTAYGLDSLSAVELRNRIRVRLGAELTTLDITNTPSTVVLCEKIVAKKAEVSAAATATA